MKVTFCVARKTTMLAHWNYKQRKTTKSLLTNTLTTLNGVEFTNKVEKRVNRETNKRHYRRDANTWLIKSSFCSKCRTEPVALKPTARMS